MDQSPNVRLLAQSGHGLVRCNISPSTAGRQVAPLTVPVAAHTIPLARLASGQETARVHIGCGLQCGSDFCDGSERRRQIRHLGRMRSPEAGQYVAWGEVHVPLIVGGSVPIRGLNRVHRDARTVSYHRLPFDRRKRPTSFMQAEIKKINFRRSATVVMALLIGGPVVAAFQKISDPPEVSAPGRINDLQGLARRINRPFIRGSLDCLYWPPR